MRILLSFFILFLFLSPLGFAEGLDEHTVLLLNFEEDSLVSEGGELAEVKDLSGNGNDALVNTQGGKPAVNAPQPSGPPQVVEGKFGSALYFDGTNFLEVVSSETVEITDDEITLEAWVKPDVLSTGADNMTVLTKDCSYYMVLRENGHLANYLYGVEPPGYHLGSIPEIDEWTHLAVTYDGEQVTLYINAEADLEVGAGGEILVSDCGDPQSIGIGCEVRIPARGEANQRYFQGAIDEVRVSNIARTANEIKESFTSGLTLSVEPKGKLAAMWGRIKT